MSSFRRPALEMAGALTATNELLSSQQRLEQLLARPLHLSSRPIVDPARAAFVKAATQSFIPVRQAATAAMSPKLSAALGDIAREVSPTKTGELQRLLAILNNDFTDSVKTKQVDGSTFSESVKTKLKNLLKNFDLSDLRGVPKGEELKAFLQRNYGTSASQSSGYWQSSGFASSNNANNSSYYEDIIRQAQEATRRAQEAARASQQQDPRKDPDFQEAMHRKAKEATRKAKEEAAKKRAEDRKKMPPSPARILNEIYKELSNFNVKFDDKDRSVSVHFPGLEQKDRRYQDLLRDMLKSIFDREMMNVLVNNRFYDGKSGFVFMSVNRSNLDGSAKMREDFPAILKTLRREIPEMIKNIESGWIKRGDYYIKDARKIPFFKELAQVLGLEEWEYMTHGNLAMIKNENSFLKFHSNFYEDDFVIDGFQVIDRSDSTYYYKTFIDAIQHRNVDVMMQYIKDGFSVNTKVDGEYPLHAAIRYQEKEMVDFLLKHGASPFLLDDKGQDAFQAAVKKDRDMLANGNVDKSSTQPLLEWAITNDQKFEASTLRKQGAKVHKGFHDPEAEQGNPQRNAGARPSGDPSGTYGRGTRFDSGYDPRGNGQRT